MKAAHMDDQILTHLDVTIVFLLLCSISLDENNNTVCLSETGTNSVDGLHNCVDSAVFSG